ncbi:MAG: endonuclease [Blastocatellia bacterium]|jgi:formamidopyrimidine-DNA glycosylase|nr:endonuclease [Blastocatellia bacterium]
MPEGPEVRKYADAVNLVLHGRQIVSLQARTRDAKQWLKENEDRLIGRRVLRVVSHGKHLLGYIYGGFYFHSHLMMWGRWQTLELRSDSMELPEKDRRERARIIADGGAALLFSAPIFNVGKGDPYKQIENLATLGPDVLPYKGKFNAREFLRRLRVPEHDNIAIGAALLDQRILAGLGNYLRAEVLFECRINPWRKIGELTGTELECLSRTAPEMSLRAYAAGGTAAEKYRARMRNDASLVYQPGREYGTRHMVFRRTNLPCLVCGEPIKQLRQPTYNSGESDGEERTRIVYFCPNCQSVGARQCQDRLR